MSRGLFVTLEGIEGAGKSTVAAIAGKWLERAGHTVRLTREPGGTPLAERIRQIVLARGEEALPPLAETLLMFAARAQHVAGVIRPALARGEWVVCDRFTDATRAYQGSARGVDGELIETLAQAVHGDLTPDCTLLLELPVQVGLQRVRARRGAGSDRFEAETVEFFEKVRAGYLKLARADPQRFRIIDATTPLAQVETRVTAILAQLHAQSAPP
jgi:dTMP kinase